MIPKRGISYYAHLSLTLILSIALTTGCSEKKTEKQKYNQTNSEVEVMAPLVQVQAPVIPETRRASPIIQYDFIPNPQYTPWPGTRKAQAKWKDARGNNVIIVSEVSQYFFNESKPEIKKYKENEEDNEVAELIVRHYLLPADSTKWQLYWDFHKVKFSSEDVGIDYMPGTLIVSDIDSNGLTESIFSYHVTIGTQAIDFHYEGNLVMHIDSTEYWMKGTIGLMRNTDDFKQRTEFSPNFQKLGDVYKNHIAHHWQHNIVLRDSLDNALKKMWE